MPGMRSALPAFTALCALLATWLSATPARAQSGGRVAVGAAVAFFGATGERIDNSVRVTPLVRVRRTGWAPALAFHWFTTDADLETIGAVPARGELTVRPIMAGVSYTVTRGRLATSVGAVGGYAFNRIATNADASSVSLALDVENSVAWAPQVTTVVDLTRRVGLVTQASYLIARPTVTVTTDNRVERSRWKADALVLQTGLVIRLF